MRVWLFVSPPPPLNQKVIQRVTWPHTVVHVKNIFLSIIIMHYCIIHPIAMKTWEAVEYSPAKVSVIGLTFVHIGVGTPNGNM